MCPLYLLTGVRCPLCGMTHATLRLLHGDLDGALYYHPLAPLVLALIFAAIVAVLLTLARGRRLPRAGRAQIAMLVAVTAAVWAVNLRFGH